MTSWEAVRERARRFRAEALLAAGDGSPAAVVRAARALAGIEEEVRNDEAVDSDARLLGDGRRIVVVPGRSEPEILEDIAHELGHNRLHRDPVFDDGHRWGGAVDGEPTGRRVPVDGYSDRQTKEAQARAFADEFLCPAQDVRAMLARGSDPAAISRALGLPQALVLRQAVEALLLPREPRVRAGAWSGRVGPDGRGAGPDDVQAECMAWQGSPLLVVGAAGTGKTTTLVRRLHLLLATGTRPASVMLVTANRPAADRIVSALADDHPEVAGSIWAGAIEDLAHEVVVRWPGRVGRTGDVRVLDRPSALAILADLMERDEAGRPRPGRAGEALRRFDAARAGARRARPCSGTAPVLDLEREAYAAAMAAADSVDAGGLVTLAAEILRRDPAIVATLRLRFSSLIVDDLHDLPEAGVDLLRLLSPVGADVWATGDPGQAIDGFRGRRGHGVDAFLEAFRPIVRVLRRNHRCAPAVSAVADACRGDRGTASRGPGVTLTAADTPELEAELVADRALSLNGTGTPWADQAVLAWSHATLTRIARAMRRRGIPVVHLGDVGRRREVLDMLAFASLALEDHGPSFARVARSAPYRLSDATIESVTGPEDRPAASILDALARIDRSRVGDAAEARRLSHLAADVSELRRSTLHPGLADWAFAPGGRLASLLAAPDSAETREALAAVHHVLVACAERHELGSHGMSALRDGVAAMASLGQRTRFHATATVGADMDAVRFHTIHAARGMEFEVVHLAGVRVARPRKGRPSHDDADKILHVAVSRARTQLHVTRPLTFQGRPCAAPAVLESMADRFTDGALDAPGIPGRRGRSG